MSDNYSLCQVCAGVGGTDTCNGDSGGPLLADKLGDRSDILTVTPWAHNVLQVECHRHHEFRSGVRPTRLPRGVHQGGQVHSLDQGQPLETYNTELERNQIWHSCKIKNTNETYPPARFNRILRLWHEVSLALEKFVFTCSKSLCV